MPSPVTQEVTAENLGTLVEQGHQVAEITQSLVFAATLREATQNAIGAELEERRQALGPNGELRAPSGSIFGLVFPVHIPMEYSDLRSERWVNRGSVLPSPIDDTDFDGYKFVPKPNKQIRYEVPTAVILQNDSIDSPTPGALRAISANGNSGLLIPDRSVGVVLLPELTELYNTYVRTAGSAEITPTRFE